MTDTATTETITVIDDLRISNKNDLCLRQWNNKKLPLVFTGADLLDHLTSRSFGCPE